jgi:DNA processing protein
VALERVRAALALRAVPGVGDVRFVRLVERWGTPEAVLAAGEAELASRGVGPELARAIAATKDFGEVDREIERAARAGARFVVWGDSEYPPGLRWIFDPPPVLRVKGELRREDVLAVAIVGARDASPVGLAAARTIAEDLARAGVTVVSGLARGIDGEAHRAALDAGGRTIAVLGSGIDRIYPRGHRGLAERIVQSGALVSELPCGTDPAPENFPRRNRIVSGLALAVVVVEASERSGSLITARLAAQQGREVFAVPGEPNSERTRGTHQLLREGAALAERGEDVVVGAMPWLFGSTASQPPGATITLDPPGPELLGVLSTGLLHVDEIVERSGLPAARVLETLLELELRGLAMRHPGGFYSRRR